MLTITLHLDGDNCWADLARESADYCLHNAQSIAIALLNDDTITGNPTVVFRLDLPDNKVVLAETNLDLFIAAAKKLDSVRELRSGKTLEPWARQWN